jgi:hypothetical protein
MKLLVRAVVTGFGLSIGAALYKKVAKQLGLEEKPSDPTRAGAGAATEAGTLSPHHHAPRGN